MKVLRHFFFPHQDNNHRAKLLHAKSILSIIVLLLVGQFFVHQASVHFQNVLGAATDLSVQELLELTNQKRAEHGLKPVVLESHLMAAAKEKSNYMFAKNFWAHVSPDGTQPWYFFKKAGYDYTYAGENLARGFTSSQEVINAWMDSPTHRENVLSPNYDEIGFAIQQGKLIGENTTLIVELFGSRPGVASAKDRATTQLLGANAIKTSPLVDTTTFARNISFVVIVIFLFVFCLDMIIVEKKKIYRLVGHNTDHILYLSLVIIFIIATRLGSVQ